MKPDVLMDTFAKFQNYVPTEIIEYSLQMIAVNSSWILQLYKNWK
jgi:hypothetical protein